MLGQEALVELNLYKVRLVYLVPGVGNQRSQRVVVRQDHKSLGVVVEAALEQKESVGNGMKETPHMQPYRWVKPRKSTRIDKIGKGLAALVGLSQLGKLGKHLWERVD
jgi:hypothetical protein